MIVFYISEINKFSTLVFNPYHSFRSIRNLPQMSQSLGLPWIEREGREAGGQDKKRGKSGIRKKASREGKHFSLSSRLKILLQCARTKQQRCQIGPRSSPDRSTRTGTGTPPPRPPSSIPWRCRESRAPERRGWSTWRWSCWSWWGLFFPSFLTFCMLLYVVMGATKTGVILWKVCRGFWRVSSGFKIFPSLLGLQVTFLILSTLYY